MTTFPILVGVRQYSHSQLCQIHFTLNTNVYRSHSIYLYMFKLHVASLAMFKVITLLIRCCVIKIIDVWLPACKLHRRDHYHAFTQVYNVGAETHHSPLWRRYKCFCHAIGCLCSSALVNFSCQYSLMMGPQRFWPHSHDHCSCWHAKTRCSSNFVSAIIIFCLPFGCHCWLDIDWAWLSHDVCVNWN